MKGFLRPGGNILLSIGIECDNVLTLTLFNFCENDCGIYSFITETSTQMEERYIPVQKGNYGIKY